MGSLTSGPVTTVSFGPTVQVTTLPWTLVDRRLPPLDDDDIRLLPSYLQHLCHVRWTQGRGKIHTLVAVAPPCPLPPRGPAPAAGHLSWRGVRVASPQGHSRGTGEEVAPRRWVDDNYYASETRGAPPSSDTLKQKNRLSGCTIGHYYLGKTRDSNSMRLKYFNLLVKT